MAQLLVVEDDKSLNEIVCEHLRRQGYQVRGCFNENDAFNEMHDRLYDMVISDIMMPGIDGYEMAKKIRELRHDIPILFMTAKDDFYSKQKGFEVGVDDYMVKPINLDELGWRVQALLRRARIEEKSKLTIGSLEMNKDDMSVTVNGEEIPVTVREFNILYKLLSYPKRTFSREQLFDEFWDLSSESGLRSVDVYITRLRDKFSDCSDFKIKTVYGLGYKAVLE